jgi:hypothetical protein
MSNNPINNVNFTLSERNNVDPPFFVKDD